MVGSSESRATAFRYIAGTSWLNLLATVGSPFGDHPVERLDTAARLGEWLEHEGLRPRRAPTREELSLARALRESLRPLALAAADGRRMPRDAVASLNELLDHHAEPFRLVATADGHGLGRTPPATAAEALHRLARHAADDLAGSRASQLHACTEPTCRMVYLDPTGRRRWCSTQVCGNRARVRAHRQRVAAAE